MSDGLIVKYIAEPTLAKFHASDAFMRGVMGPIGSGKTVGNVIEILHRMRTQRVGPDRKRRSRWAIIRNTYPELRTTTLNTWTDWMPIDVAPIKLGSPIECNIEIALPDDTTIVAQVLFVSMDKPKDVRKVLSMELTGAFCNEARELPKAVIDAASSRVGRYPAKKDGGSNWSGVIMDTNPPDDSHWWYKAAEMGEWEQDFKLDLDELAAYLPPEVDVDDYRKIIEDIKGHDAWDQRNFQFFRQPGAMLPILDSNGNIRQYVPNPQAENVRNQDLGFIYWIRLLAGKDPEWIKAYLCGDYATVFDGKPVYHHMYRDSVHLSGVNLGVYSTRPLYLGWDFGLTPACLFAQVAPTGQLRVLREFICEDGGIKQFVIDVVKPALREEEFAGLPIHSFADPAGMQRAQTDEKTCIGILADQGIPTWPAHTNAFLTRRQAVIDWLIRRAGSKPAMVIDPRCNTLRKGFNGGYRFRLMQISGNTKFKEVPEKNLYSHVHDAFQYLCMGVNQQTAQAATGAYSSVGSGGSWGGI